MELFFANSQAMPAPAAPRKRGALTSSTAPRASTRTASAATSAIRPSEAGVEADLASRLEQVSLNNASATRGTAASTSRLRKTAVESSNLSSGPSKSNASSRLATPRASLETSFPSVNNTLSQLSERRKSLSPPYSIHVDFVKAVKDAAATSDASLARLRTLATSPEAAKHEFQQPRRLSIERAAILLVSLCIDASLLDLAVQQLSLIRQSLIQMYITKGSEDGIEVLATQIQGLKLEASSSKSVSRSTSTLSSKRPPSSSSSRASFKANLRETAKLLSFPPLPQIWTCEFSVEEICTSILIVQNQVLTCLYGLTEPPIERSSRTSTSMSTASRVRSGTPSVKGQEDISKVSVILEALESQAGGPLAIFRQAAEHMQPTERSKIEHYIATIYSLIMKRTSELAVNENASPLAIIKLQFYAIECLLENQSYFAPPAASAGSMDTDDKSVTSLAGNLYRALTSFGKMSTANNIPETELASQISQKVFPLVSRIGEVIKPEERLTFSKAYLELMDLLVQLFDKGKIDIAPLQRHLRLSSSISSGQLTTIETPPLTDATTDTVTEREALRFCTTLTTQVASLEQWISSGYASVQVDHLAMQDSLKYAAKILQLNVESPANVAMVKIRRTVVRSLERMHHYAYRAYKDLHKENDGDSNPRADISDVTTILKGLLSAFCVTVEVIKSISELQARAVDTLLLFARIEFRLDEPASYKPVHQYIQRCFTLLNIADSATSQDPRLLGTLASSAYSVGRALYNAEKYANAIPFLSNSCASTDAMVDVCKQADSSISLIELLDKSANRWELLGSAYMQCQEKEDAVRAYLSCLRALYQRGGGCDVAKPSLDPTFMRVLTKYTRLCILDLFMSPETASIAGVLSELSPSQMSDVAKARMLEAQSNCLHDYLHKSEAVSATNCWLDAAIAAYETCGTTSDLARRMYFVVEHGQNGVKDVEDIAKRISTLCAGEKPAPWVAESSASAKLLFALYQIRRGDSSASKILAREAKEALAILRSSLLNEQNSSAISTSVDAIGKSAVEASGVRKAVPPGKKQPSAAARSKGPQVAMVPRKPLSPKSNVKQVSNRIVTPPRQNKRIEAENNFVGSQTDTMLYGLRERLQTSREALSLFDTTACVLSIFEHTFLRLAYLRLIKSVTQGNSAEPFVLVCLDLAYEYQQLGKYARAEAMLAQAQATANKADLSSEARVLLTLRKAEYLSHLGRTKESDVEYRLALTLCERIAPGDDTNKSSRERILCRTRLLYRTAQAASCFASIAENKGECHEAMSASLQTLRLCNRALVNLSRIGNVTPKNRPATEDNESTGTQPDMLHAVSPAVSKLPLSSTGQAQSAIGWRISQLLGQTLLRLAHLYQTRGTVKLATYFYQQAAELADSFNAPRLKAKILAKHIVLDKDLNSDERVKDKLAKLSEIATKEGGLSTVDVLHLSGQVSARQGNYESAEKAFNTALGSLRKLDKAFRDTDGHFPSPSRRASLSPSKNLTNEVNSAILNETVLPCMQGAILEQCIAMFSASGQSEQVRIWLDQLGILRRGSKERLEDSILTTELRLSEILVDIRQDPVAGLLRESVLSIPSLISHGQQVLMDSSTRFVAGLGEIELELLGSAVTYQMKAGPVRWRNLSGAIAQLRILQAGLGRLDSTTAIGVASALQSGTAVTARREMIEVLHQKLTHGILRDDLVWPHSQPRLTNSKPLSVHWKQLEDRYSRTTSKGIADSDNISCLLPKQWSALSLHVTPDATSLLAVLYTCDSQPLILQLPFDRVSRRDGDEKIFDLQAARLEMSDITLSANATSQNAKNVTSSEDRRSWWTERKALDRRLAALLIDIEKKWLGAFKNIVEKKSNTVTDTPSQSTRYPKLLDIIQKTIHYSHTQKAANLQLDSALVEMFYSLPNEADDDDLEDWLHFIVDSLQFAGVRVAYDEIDLDQAVVDLRSLLEERSQDNDPSDAGSSSPSDSHLFLILDKGLHCFPWESLPCLAKSSVSRLPSLDYLRDRLQYRKYTSGGNSSYPGLEIDSTKLFYLLNPDGDLTHTQREFSDLLQAKQWPGVVGRVPMEEEMRRHLSSQDLFLYLGHGGAEQYIRPHVLQALPSCATTLLWGCSSGHLKEQGDYEEVGTPLVYMQAGAPAVVGNLWDVTDKDIDRFTHSTLEKFGLLGDSDQALSLPAAIAASRTACSLRYLNGASPVVWGIPVKVIPSAAPAPS